jgi:hypothetical protein
MNKEKEKKIVEGFEALMEKRGITDRKAYFVYLREQKLKKYEASEARMTEAEEELEVLKTLLRGEI